MPVCVAVTATVLIVNTALDAPAATLTLAGAVAAASVSVSVTTMPPDGAGPVRVTFPVTDFDPAAALDESVRLLRAVGFTVSVLVFVMP